MKSITKYKYIIIEDIIEVINGIKDRLDDYPEWQCVGESREISKALHLVQQKRPELIIMDWHIKGGSTFEILEWIKASNYNPYVIYITAYQQDEPEIPEIIINSYSVDKYIQKPIWQNLAENLAVYLQEAIAKAVLNTPKVLVKTAKGTFVNVDIKRINSIVSFDAKKRTKIFRFTNNKNTLEVKLTFLDVENFLRDHNIDFFYTVKRESIVIRDHIKEYDGCNVHLKGTSILKMKISKRIKKDFEDWLLI